MNVLPYMSEQAFLSWIRSHPKPPDISFLEHMMRVIFREIATDHLAGGDLAQNERFRTLVAKVAYRAARSAPFDPEQ